MAYFKINGHDYSTYVSSLKVTKKVIYKSAVNAAGNTVVKYVNTKRDFTVGIIPLDAAAMANLQADLSSFKVSVSYRDPETNELVENVNCIIPVNEVDYYTIQADKVLYRTFLVTLLEL
jgi:hypothetical protein